LHAQLSRIFDPFIIMNISSSQPDRFADSSATTKWIHLSRVH
jgi:hypothetical protein